MTNPNEKLIIVVITLFPMPHHKQTPNKYERGIGIGVIVLASGIIICMPE